MSRIAFCTVLILCLSLSSAVLHSQPAQATGAPVVVTEPAPGPGQMAPARPGPGAPYSLIIMLLILTVAVIPTWKIFKKCGHNPWLSLFLFFPPAFVVIAYIVAFTDGAGAKQS